VPEDNHLASPDRPGQNAKSEVEQGGQHAIFNPICRLLGGDIPCRRLRRCKQAENGSPKRWRKPFWNLRQTEQPSVLAVFVAAAASCRVGPRNDVHKDARRWMCIAGFSG